MALKISRILHAGYVLEHMGCQIAFDPIFENPFSRNCFPFPNIEFDQDKIKELSFNAVFISHYHDDHCSFESLKLLKCDTPIYVYCIFEELFGWLKELGFNSVYSLKLNETVQIGDMKITPRRALDEDVDSLFQIQVEDLNILNVVDSWIDNETLNQLMAKGPWDLIMWPFQTMRELEVLAPKIFPKEMPRLPEECLFQLQKLNPKFLVPSSCQFIHESWSWYNSSFFPITYKYFENEMSKILPKTQVVRMNPGVSVNLSKMYLQTEDSLPWIVPVGDQDVDYSYQHNLIPPLTSEISKCLPPLSQDQKNIVIQYCKEGLLQKFNKLEVTSEEYFHVPRLWKLSVFDELGTQRNFYYQICRTDICLLEAPNNQVAWSTEAPITKLYAALTDGESLTSMYVRINDAEFSSDVLENLKQIDILEDPLCRCLFNGEFGSYQKNQLKKILATQ